MCSQLFGVTGNGPINNVTTETVMCSQLFGVTGNVSINNIAFASKRYIKYLHRVVDERAFCVGMRLEVLHDEDRDFAYIVSPRQKYLGTAGVPLGRIGLPEEIAAAVSYLVSPSAAFVTGANLKIDGGLSA